MFYFLNRWRGTKTIWAKWTALITGTIFGVATGDPFIGLAVSIGYLAGESMGWGEWIGGLIRITNYRPQLLNPRRDGTYNGIQWIAERFTIIDTVQYHSLALGIRGFYWWLLAFAPLLFVTNPVVVLMAVLALALAFPLSVLAASREGDQWENAEYIYGTFQDITISLLVVHLLTT